MEILQQSDNQHVAWEFRSVNKNMTFMRLVLFTRMKTMGLQDFWVYYFCHIKHKKILIRKNPKFQTSASCRRVAFAVSGLANLENYYQWWEIIKIGRQTYLLLESWPVYPLLPLLLRHPRNERNIRSTFHCGQRVAWLVMDIWTWQCLAPWPPQLDVWHQPCGLQEEGPAGHDAFHDVWKYKQDI